MSFSKLLQILLLLASVAPRGVHARVNILLEFKGSAFLPTGSCFKDIYHHCGALYGPELTVQLGHKTPLCAFASVEYFSKEGQSIGCCDSTTAQIVPIGFGLKYLAPLPLDNTSIYCGLGFQATHVKITNCSPFVVPHTSKWGVGGITKLGLFIDLARHFVLDLFFDYSFVKVGSNEACCSLPKINISGAILGAGLAYRF